MVRKHLYELKKHVHNPDERKVWLSVLRFWVVSLTQLGVPVQLSEVDISMLVKTASNFDDICNRIIEITPDSTPDPLDVAKQMGGDYGAAIMAAYQGRDHADQIKARIAELLS